MVAPVVEYSSMWGRLQLCKREILARRGAKALALFAWEDGARGGEGAGAVPLGDWCVLDKKVCWSNDLGEEQCTTAREPGGSFAVRAIALSK